MKKKTITIGALLLAMNSFSQTDTLSFAISGKEKYEFNYRNSIDIIKNITSPQEYQDFNFKLKKNDVLYLDLLDDTEPDTLYLMYRGVTIYYRNGEVEKLYLNSGTNTLSIDGSLVKKVIVHKPELK